MALTHLFQINYKLPVFGGCFGQGCRVAFGENFSGHGDKKDVSDCVGHGTEVAAVAAGYDKAKNFVGAAPNATIMAYKVIHCDANILEEDNLVAAWLQAKADGAKIIISSSGFIGRSWAHTLAATTVSRIVASGIPCVNGIGNDLGNGLFNTQSPSSGHGVTSVTSVGHEEGQDEAGSYSLGDGSAPIEFSFIKGRNNWQGKDWQLHDLDGEYGEGPDFDPAKPGHDTKNGNEPCLKRVGFKGDDIQKDLVGKMVLIRLKPETPDCRVYDREANAAYRGAAGIIYWEDKPASAPGSGFSSVQVTAATDAKTGRNMAKAIASGKNVTVRRVGTAQSGPVKVASLSALGPTWDLNIKPEIAAPGEYVPAISKEGEDSTVWGTSFAGPLVAGIFALVAENRKVFDAKALNSILISTADPIMTYESGKLRSVVQQGGGVVKAWDAAHATTLIEPATLPFNDTDHRVKSFNLIIKNTAKKEVTYQLSNLAASTLYALDEGAVVPRMGVADEAQADIKFSKTSLTVGAGQSATVEVSAIDPKGLNPKRLPLWSGWVKIQGSDGKNLTVPYLGLGGSLRSATVLDPNPQKKYSSSWPAKSNFIFPDPSNGQKPGPSGGIKEPQGAQRKDGISYAFDLALGSPEVRVDIVPLDVCSSPSSSSSSSSSPARVGPPSKRATANAKASATDLTQACVPSSLLTDFNGIKTMGQAPGFPQHWASRHNINDWSLKWTNATWQGTFAPGKYAPPGRYKFVVQALAIMGDAKNKDHWQKQESPEFSIAYAHNIGNGEKQPGTEADKKQPQQPQQQPAEPKKEQPTQDNKAKPDPKLAETGKNPVESKPKQPAQTNNRAVPAKKKQSPAGDGVVFPQ